MNKLILGLLISLFAASCKVITETPGFYVGYERLSEKEIEQVVFVNPQETITDRENDQKIYAINGKQLREFISKSDTSVVYIWAPKCHSSVCISLLSCQKYCSDNNYDLVVVAEYYDMEMMELQNHSKSPIFIANHQYYNKRYCPKLTKLFLKELLGPDFGDQKKEMGRFLRRVFD